MIPLPTAPRLPARKQFRAVCRTARNPDGTYGAPCAICREPINYALTYPHPAAFSVDHLQPVRTAPELAEPAELPANTP